MHKSLIALVGAAGIGVARFSRSGAGKCRLLRLRGRRRYSRRRRRRRDYRQRHRQQSAAWLLPAASWILSAASRRYGPPRSRRLWPAASRAYGPPPGAEGPPPPPGAYGPPPPGAYPPPPAYAQLAPGCHWGQRRVWVEGVGYRTRTISNLSLMSASLLWRDAELNWPACASWPICFCGGAISCAPADLVITMRPSGETMRVRQREYRREG